MYKIKILYISDIRRHKIVALGVANKYIDSGLIN
jgi:hypothetical protein